MLVNVFIHIGCTHNYNVTGLCCGEKCNIGEGTAGVMLAGTPARWCHTRRCFGGGARGQ